MKGRYSRGLSESQPQCRRIASARVCLHARSDGALRGNEVRTDHQIPPNPPPGSQNARPPIIDHRRPGFSLNREIIQVSARAEEDAVPDALAG
jgi:hypothetical protein